MSEADSLDHATALTQLSTDIAIRAVLQNLNPPLPANQRGKIIYRTCEECGNEIPQARIQALNARLCVECQRAIELDNKVYRGRNHE